MSKRLEPYLIILVLIILLILQSKYKERIKSNICPILEMQFLREYQMNYPL